MTLEEAQAIAQALPGVLGTPRMHMRLDEEHFRIRMLVDGNFTAEEFEAFAVLCRDAERRGESLK